jgi:hypothetical protein
MESVCSSVQQQAPESHEPGGAPWPGRLTSSAVVPGTLPTEGALRQWQGTQHHGFTSSGRL